jgi:hypothetical protein
MRADAEIDLIYQKWLNGDYMSSDSRPMTRVSIHRATINEFPTQHRLYRSWLDGEFDPEFRELPNLQSVKISRTLDQDAATCEVVIKNIAPLGVGDEPEYVKDIDNEGWYSPNHGVGEFSTRWGYLENIWRGWIQPDRIIKTFQGFGVDFDVPPSEDPNLVLTGVWIIDKVTLDARSQLTISCRDMGELLIDQYIYKRVIGEEADPLVYETKRMVERSKTRTETTTTVIPGVAGTMGARLGGVSHNYNSNYYWASSGCVSGHCGSHAFDADPGSYWISIGNGGANQPWAYEWVQANTGGQSVGAVKFLPWAGNYVVYVGVRINGTWQGANTVPYDPQGVGAPNQSNKRYVIKTTCGWEKWCAIDLPNIYQKVEVVRLTFHNLADSGFGTYQYRAGVRQFEVYNGPIVKATAGIPPKTVVSTEEIVEHYMEQVGTIDDYTQIVKDILCIGGFLMSMEKHPGIQPDPDITQVCGEAIGRVYGDLERSGTAPVLDIPRSEIDNQALIDVIRYAQEVLGFIFYINELGGAVFRSPNLWQVGNYLTNDPSGRARTTGMVTIDESVTLLDWSVDLSNATKRKWVVIGNSDGTMHAETFGKDPIASDEYPLNVGRLSMWTDQNFISQEECIVMGDMVKLRQWFQYRVGRAQIIGNPMIQIDDQIRVYERRTGEGYIHYVQGIDSNWEAKSGKYTMDLTTAWLGEQPTTLGGTTWLFDIDDLDPVSQEFLFANGRLGI